MNVLLIDNHVVTDSLYLPEFKDVLERLGTRCEMRDFTDKSISTDVDQFDAVVLSGSKANLSEEETIKNYRHLIELVQTTATPILGVCFGHQLIGAAFGSQIVPLGRDIREFNTVDILESLKTPTQQDPLFDSLPNVITVYQAHQEIVKSLPKNFKLLASSNETTIEAMVHEKRLIYGIQFHAECYNALNMDGKIVLQNFFSLVKK